MDFKDNEFLGGTAGTCLSDSEIDLKYMRFVEEEWTRHVP